MTEMTINEALAVLRGVERTTTERLDGYPHEQRVLLWDSILAWGDDPVVRPYLRGVLGEVPTLEHLLWEAFALSTKPDDLAQRLHRCGCDVQVTRDEGREVAVALMTFARWEYLWATGIVGTWWRRGRRGPFVFSEQEPVHAARELVMETARGLRSFFPVDIPRLVQVAGPRLVRPPQQGPAREENELALYWRDGTVETHYAEYGPSVVEIFTVRVDRPFEDRSPWAPRGSVEERQRPGFYSGGIYSASFPMTPTQDITFKRTSVTLGCGCRCVAYMQDGDSRLADRWRRTVSTWHVCAALAGHRLRGPR